MGEEPKKISFGFSKTNKKAPPLLSKVNEDDNNVQFINFLEDKSIKLLNGSDENKKKLPVIPMRTASSLRDSIVDTIKSRQNHVSKVENDKPPDHERPLTLDELAAKELIEGTSKDTENDPSKIIKEVPIPNQSSSGEKESTLDDYENMPITDFGLAMLRGMGWDPSKGIGLNGKVVQTSAPTLRPKGMGLGADKVLIANKDQQLSSTSDDLVLKVGAPVKILSGVHKNLYGKVEGFDELPGRILVRLTIKNSVVSLSEFTVQPVPLTEYNKNSKVMNIEKYTEFSIKGQSPIKNEDENQTKICDERDRRYSKEKSSTDAKSSDKRPHKHSHSHWESRSHKSQTECQRKRYDYTKSRSRNSSSSESDSGSSQLRREKKKYLSSNNSSKKKIEERRSSSDFSDRSIDKGSTRKKSSGSSGSSDEHSRNFGKSRRKSKSKNHTYYGESLGKTSKYSQPRQEHHRHSSSKKSSKHKKERRRSRSRTPSRKHRRRRSSS